ncbi:MAG TPA: sensor histidine kinase [Desulfobacteraceae bacterium]|nr:MAG: two-component sensor histidine kinase [Desulfobacteraceae bacterium 4484_190.3]HDL07277.1 sensor histidine kinase [Desulfobacteraceae bacterium]
MKKEYYATVRRTILARMILVPFVPFLLVLLIGYYYFTNSLQNSTIASISRIAGDHKHMIESFLNERKTDLEYIQNSYSFEDLSSQEKMLNIFERLQKKSNTFVDLGIFNEAGIHVNYCGPYKLTGKVYSEAGWFKEVMKRGYYISDIFLGYRRIPHFIIALTRADGEKKWVIRATIDTYMFNDLVEKVRIGKTGEAYLLNADGVFQTERRSGGSFMSKDPDYLKYPAIHDGIKTFIAEDLSGNKHLYAITRMKDNKWLLVVRQEKADAFRALRSAAYLIILITIVGGTGIIGTAFYLTDRIVRRIELTDTEKKQLGEQLIRASRLAEIGEMATGIAHEINNPLQIMKSEQALIDTIISDLKEKGELKESEALDELMESFNQITLQINRCSQITQSVLKFGRKTEHVLKDIDLRSFIPDVASMVENKAKVEGITISQDISEDIPLINGDPAQLQQVLLNLFNNAIDAVVSKHGSEGGALAVKAGKKEDGKVEISVQDNGAGISSENLQKIFSPFFTTKPVGKGTGLGLSVCYGIIKAMGGALEVSSKEDIGTTFMITLPAAV